MKTIALGDVGIRYVWGSLRDVLPLARLAEDLLRLGTSFALASERFPENAVQDFRHGHRSACDIGDVAESLRRLFPHAWLAVGLPLVRPDDPWISEGRPQLRGELQIDGPHAYAVCRLSAPRETVEAVLRAHDPSFLYNAVIVEPAAQDETGVNLRQQVEEGLARIVAVLVGAYDGEGFVLAH